MNILDTAGDIAFDALRNNWIREVRVCLLVFSFDNANSLRDLQEFIQKIIMVKESLNNCILIGNKIDMIGTDKQQIQESEVTEFIDHYGYMPYFQISCKDKLWTPCITDLFTFAVKYCWIRDIL